MVLTYTTSRLSVFKITGDTVKSEISDFLAVVPKLLSPKVVEGLPPYFRNIESPKDALAWFEQMVSTSQLFVIKPKSADTTIGCLFVSIENNLDAYIGYLLGEAFWGQGLASELLRGFIDHAYKNEGWEKLVGGVDHNNPASSNLLLKLNFTAQPDGTGQVTFYEYRFPRPKF